MTDDERSDKMAEFYHEVALKKRKDEGPVPCGYCHNCHDTLDDGRRFCDSDCRDDWENRNARGC